MFAVGRRRCVRSCRATAFRSVVVPEEAEERRLGWVPRRQAGHGRGVVLCGLRSGHTAP